MLHTGGYRPGKNPGTFICNQNSCKGSSSERGTTHVSSGCPSSPSSVLLAPLKAPVEPVSPSPAYESWTASAQKTQSARQRFFQAEVAEVTAGDRTPVKVHKEDRATAGKNLAEENRNNNNKRPFTIRSADRR